MSAYFAFWYQPARVRVGLNHEPALVIEALREPAEAPERTTAQARLSAMPRPQPVFSPPEKKTLAVNYENASPAPVKPTVIPERREVPPVKVPENRASGPSSKAVISTASVSVPTPPDAEKPAKYLFNPLPEYPVECRKRKEEGLVVLMAQVNCEGLPGAIRIVQSSNHPMLDAAAVAGVRLWRFAPARLGNRAVASQIEIPIRFKLSKSK